MENLSSLGDELMVGAYCVEGYVHPKEAIRLQREIIKVVQMRPVGKPVVRVYPVASPDWWWLRRFWWQLRYWLYDKLSDGAGKEGETTLWAHATIQPLAESISGAITLPGFVATDTWPEKLRGKGKFYIILASCALFESVRVRNHLICQGWKVRSYRDLIVG